MIAVIQVGRYLEPRRTGQTKRVTGPQLQVGRHAELVLLKRGAAAVWRRLRYRKAAVIRVTGGNSQRRYTIDVVDTGKRTLTRCGRPDRRLYARFGVKVTTGGLVLCVQLVVHLIAGANRQRNFIVHGRDGVIGKHRNAAYCQRNCHRCTHALLHRNPHFA